MIKSLKLSIICYEQKTRVVLTRPYWYIEIKLSMMDHLSTYRTSMP